MSKCQIVTLCCINNPYIYEMKVNIRDQKINVFNKALFLTLSNGENPWVEALLPSPVPPRSAPVQA